MMGKGYEAMSKLAIIGASGNGKTTLGRELARRLRVPFVELDGLVHGPGWQETSDAELRALLAPVIASPGWVIDGSYDHKIGHLVLQAADQVVWLDLPIRVWLPRLLRRTARRIRGDEPLWNDNQESWVTALWGRDSLVLYTLRAHFHRRRVWPRELASFPVVRLRTRSEVDQFLARSQVKEPPGR